MAKDEEGVPCPLPLAFLPDGALGLVLSFGSVADLIAANMVCQSWLIDGNRLDLWKALGESFEVSMPTSLGRRVGGRRVDGVVVGGGKRMLRSAANAKRTFFKSYATTVKTCGLKHDATLSEAYALFRAQDSVPKLRGLLRRRWKITFPSSSSSSSSKTRTAAARCGKTNATGAATSTTLSSRGHSSAAIVVAPSSGKNRASPAFDKGDAWRGKGRWTFDVNHRHGIWEGNTLLNFAVRCGRRKSIEFILNKMGADTEVADDGGFTPLLNTAWRGDAPLLKVLIAAGARLDVKGASRGAGPFGPLEWATLKDRPVTATFLRNLAAAGGGGGGGGGSKKRGLEAAATSPCDGGADESSSDVVL